MKEKNLSTSKYREGKAFGIVFYVLTAVYAGLCFYLFYNQSLQPAAAGNHYFESDLPYHISMVVDDGWFYSLTAFIYLALYKLTGGGTVLIAAFLALVMGGTVIATERLLRELFGDNSYLSKGGALSLNFLMPFYIYWAGMYRYVSYQSGNVWHNSTYICMRFSALCFLIFFVKYSKTYAQRGLKVKEWIVLSVLLFVTTFIKPSFLTVFAPALALKLLWDLFKNKVKFVRVLMMGLTVIPSLAVILWQNSVLFSSGSENGYRISFMETFSLHADHPKVTVILSLAFPLAIGLIELIRLLMGPVKGKNGEKEVKKAGFDKFYIFSILMAVVGFAEAILLVETGSRSRDGNFLWGYSSALFVLNLTGFKKWGEYIRDRKWAAFIFGALVFLYQFVCGAIFFARLISGETYFMIG